jgi:serine/threonine-protein kinase
MGEVYRARDTKLDRDVALKLLPSEFSGDPERLARLDREARLLASFQHPGIASIYGYEHVEGVRFLTMELVEGEDLSERIQRDPIPLHEAIEIAEQVANALEAAHRKNIIHRDLKPANIKVDQDGVVKVLDFGLARVFADDEPDPEDLEHSPTITAAMTHAGVIMGTAAYMSPEQARGRGLDRQSDIWSFGVVLYEMITGDQLFGGDTVSDSIGAILNRDPDLEKLAGAPPALRRLIVRCLQRDKRQRLRDAGDARLELVEARQARVDSVATRTQNSRRGWVTAAIMAALALAFGWLSFSSPETRRSSVTTIGMPRGQFLNYTLNGSWPSFDISPDGKHVVYAGGIGQKLYLRETDSFALRTVSEMQCFLPTFSPDGNWIAFFAESKLWKVAVTGGAPVEVCETENGPGLAWGPEDFYFPTDAGSPLWTVPVGGGELRLLSELDDAADETSHRWPHVLPGGRHALLTIKTAGIESLNDAAIGLLDLESGEHSILLQGGTDARYVPTGHIVYGRGDELFAVRFDLASLSLQGTPVPVFGDVYLSAVNGSVHAKLSAAGDLTYVPATDMVQDWELVWVELSGRVTPLPIADQRFLAPEISPDGNRFAGLRLAANDKIWTFDLRRETASRLTSTPGNDFGSVWSPDAKSIVYGNDRGGGLDLYLIPADGSAPARKIVEGEGTNFASDWSPDGSVVLFSRLKDDGDLDIWEVAMDGSDETRPYLETQHSEFLPQFSPDGKWVAYVSDVAGEQAIYVRPFPAGGTAVRASAEASTVAGWSPDGRTLYYTGDGAIYAVAIDTTSGLEVGDPEVVVALDPRWFGSYSLHPDGTKFLVNRADPEVTRQHEIQLDHCRNGIRPPLDDPRGRGPR